MKVLGHVVSEKIFFYVFPMTTPRDGACMDPRGTVGRVYEEDHYTLLYTQNVKVLGHVVLEIFLCFSHLSLSVAIETKVLI